jgi:tripartite-type tricarboxylate transporter receptor subunit TctC
MVLNQIGYFPLCQSWSSVANTDRKTSNKDFPAEEATMLFRATLLASCAVCALSGVLDGVEAQSYPSRGITLVVPFPAGGPTDTIGRIMAEGLRASLGQTVIVENVPGATGSIGSGRVARAETDGYTLVLGTVATHVFNGAAYALKYDVVNDFDAISLVAFDPQIIVVNKSIPVSDLKQLIGWLKANPNKATAGTAGVGSTSHISGVNFQKLTGTQFRFVPYRGLGPALQDVVGGQIDILFDLAANSVPQVRSGGVKALAVTAKNRLPSAPDVPTVDEAGLPGFYFVNWHGMWAPHGTPADVIAKLNAATAKALADPATLRRLADIGQQIPPREQQTAAALTTYQNEEIVKWWPVIKAANIKGE